MKALFHRVHVRAQEGRWADAIVLECHGVFTQDSSQLDGGTAEGGVGKLELGVQGSAVGFDYCALNIVVDGVQYSTEGRVVDDKEAKEHQRAA